MLCYTITFPGPAKHMTLSRTGLAVDAAASWIEIKGRNEAARRAMHGVKFWHRSNLGWPCLLPHCIDVQRAKDPWQVASGDWPYMALHGHLSVWSNYTILYYTILYYTTLHYTMLYLVETQTQTLHFETQLDTLTRKRSNDLRHHPKHEPKHILGSQKLRAQTQLTWNFETQPQRTRWHIRKPYNRLGNPSTYNEQYNW